MVRRPNRTSTHLSLRVRDREGKIYLECQPDSLLKYLSYPKRLFYPPTPAFSLQIYNDPFHTEFKSRFLPNKGN